MRSIIWSPEAEEDLRRIEERLDSIDPGLADRLAGEIDRAVRRLIDFPMSAPASGLAGLRKLSLTRLNYIVFYRMMAGDVELARLRHASEDWAAL